MCNNCQNQRNCCCGLFNLLFGNNSCGNNRSGCGCNSCGNNRSGCGCENNHNCGCFDEYYAAQYGLNRNGCGCSDWFTIQSRTSDGCNCGCRRSRNCCNND